MSGTHAKIDSNVTGLRYAEEETLQTLPATPTWITLEPNSYSDFGGQTTLIARNPINSSRQRKKGVITDLDASGGFETDLTQDNMTDMFQGLFFADHRTKAEFEDIGAVTTSTIAITDTTGFTVGSLVKTSGMGVTSNNGMRRVTTVTSNTSLTLTPALTAETNAPATSKVVEVGYQCASGDINVTTTGSFATYTSTTLDFTTLGLIPGEWIYVGGDEAALKFVTAANNGFKRVRSVAANALVVDKSEADMSNETGSGLTIQIFFGKVLKNETGTDIVRRTYQLERSLGAPVIASPNDEQAEYLTGALWNEATIKIPQANKVMMDCTFVACDHETVDDSVGLKSGNRPTLLDSDAFNTSSDFSRLRMSLVSSSDEAPEPLFAYLTEMNVTVNNNVSPNKAVSVLGAFDVTAGTFMVSADITAYFSTVSAVAAIRANSDVTLDFVLAKDNAGIAVDIPLIALGDGRLDVQQDQPITLPLDSQAATAAKIDTNLNHTMLMVFFDYLPTAAM